MTSRFCIFLICGLSSTSLAQSDPTGSMVGQVMSDIGNQGVAEARVVLSGGTLKGPLTLDTDNEGAFHFDALSAGTYRLAIEKSGYFPIGTAGTPGVTVEVGPDAKVKTGSIVLSAKRSISGSVRWRNGEPVEGAVVHALLVKRGKASLRPGDVMPVQANDRGEYRLQNMKPGLYVVYAYLQVMAHAGENPRTALPVFFPGSDRPNVDAAVDLRNARDFAGASFVLEEKPGVDVEGRVLPSTSLPKGSDVMIGLILESNPGQPFVVTEARVGGTFHLPMVPAGSYSLVAVGKRDDTEVRAIQPVMVRDSPLKDIEVNMPDALEIHGKVEVEEIGEKRERKTIPASNVRLIAESERLQILGYLPGSTNSNGEFRLKGVVMGEPYRLTLQSLPADAYVAKATYGSQDLSGAGLSIAPSGPDAVAILLRKDGASIDGTVRDENGNHVPAFVVLAPKSRAAAYLFRTAKVDSSGSFKFHAIAPGDYDVIAFDRNDDDAYLDAEVMAKYNDKSAHLSLAANGSQSLDLKIVPVERR